MALGESSSSKPWSEASSVVPCGTHQAAWGCGLVRWPLLPLDVPEVEELEVEVAKEIQRSGKLVPDLQAPSMLMSIG